MEVFALQPRSVRNNDPPAPEEEEEGLLWKRVELELIQPWRGLDLVLLERLLAAIGLSK